MLSRFRSFVLLKPEMLLWIAIALILRFLNLSAKPPWNDELATLVFSLGNSFKTVPIDQIISLDTLLEPLRPRPNASFADVIRYLMSESTHPPIYFLLTHAWLKLFPTQEGLVSVWAARSLSAILGVAAVPAVYLWSWHLWNRRTANAAAALMAVSPYGVYLAQEARHYTLAILLIIASLSCLSIALRSLHHQTVETAALAKSLFSRRGTLRSERCDPPLVPLLPREWVGDEGGCSDRSISWRFWLTWIAINSLGVATHYFFTLVLAAEGIAAASYGLWSLSRGKPVNGWRSLLISAIGTAIGGAVWLPVWLQSDSSLTTWIYDPNFLNARLAPLGRLLIWICTMLTMLPVEGVPPTVAIPAGAIMLLFLLWATRTVWSGLQKSRSPQTDLLLVLLGAIVAFLLIITYGLKADLTIAARYQFVYFPILLTLVAVAIANTARFAQTLTIFVLMGSLGGLTVACNFGYQKPDRPDQLVPILAASTQAPTVAIATAHQTYEQTRELMGLGLELHRSPRSTCLDAQPCAPSRLPQEPLFLLAHFEPDNPRSALTALEAAIAPLPRPLDLWLVNFRPAAAPAIEGCECDTNFRSLLNGYKHRLYRCLAPTSGRPGG